MPKRKKSPKIYAVAAGRSTGLFQTWAECEAQVKGYPKAVFKSFSTQYEAEVFLRQHDAISASSGASGSVNDFISTNHKRPKNDQNSHVRDVVSNDVSCHTSDSSPPAAPPQSTSHQEPSSFAIPLPLSARVQKIIFHINFDGGSRGNPKGVAGAGAHVLTRTFYTLNDGGSAEKVHRTVTDIRKFLGKGSMTNNQAEYMGAIAGLENVLVTMQQTSINLPSSIAKDSISIKILVQGDSNLVVQQLKGNWACKSANMQPLLRDTKKVLRDIEKFLGTASNYSQHGRDKRLHIDFEHVYRKDNTIADQLANEAMDAENSWTTTRHDHENGGGGNGNCGKNMGKIVYV
jgi:ribonuclease HI